MSENENRRTERQARAAVADPRFAAKYESGMARVLASLAYAEQRDHDRGPAQQQPSKPPSADES